MWWFLQLVVFGGGCVVILGSFGGGDGAGYGRCRLDGCEVVMVLVSSLSGGCGGDFDDGGVDNDATGGVNVTNFLVD